MLKVKEHLNLLGFPCKDKVTGFKGVITTIGFDLYGCIQAIVHPGMDNDGKLGEPIWLDINRLEILANVPVMEQPNFDYGDVAEGKKGPSERPPMNKM